MKEKKNTSSLALRMTVQLPADLIGPVDEIATWLYYLLCHCVEEIQQEMEGLCESCCWVISSSCQAVLTAPCSNLQARERCILCLAFLIVLVLQLIKHHQYHSWRISITLLEKSKGLPGYERNNLIHLPSPCNAEQSCRPCLKNRNNYAITSCSLIMHHTQA